MDDLILVLLGAMAAAIAVTVAIVVAVSILAATAAGAAVWALGEGVGAFTGTFATAIRERGGSRRTPRDPEPAFELYVLGQLFGDFRHSLTHAAGVLAEVRRKLAVFADKWSEGVTIPLSIGAVVGGYLGTAVAGTIGVLAGACVGLVVGLASGVSWVLIWALRLADVIRRRIRHASYECPVDHERFSLPVYVCPSCGAEHVRLVPGRWGILKRECRCGKTALPTAVINGRQRVPQRCPSGHPMSGFLGFAENLPVAIVGGPSSGKSTFLAGALIELEAPDVGVSLEPLSESQSAYSQLVEDMHEGVPPKKTTDERAPALVAEIQGAGRSRALYAYDVAGEVYGAEDKVRGLQFLARSAGIAILIDPFSIPRVAADRAEELSSMAQHILPSSEDPMRVFERLLATLKESGADIDDMPLAIVLAKADACGIDKEIEKLALSLGGDQAPRAWLEANGAGNLVRAVDREFKKVAWFSASALGRMPIPGNSQAFVPKGALAPLLWILERRNVRTTKDGAVVATHKAKSLTGTASDFPPPSPAARAWRAAAAATAAVVAILGVALALVTLTNSSNTTASASVSTEPGQANEPSSEGESNEPATASNTPEESPASAHQQATARDWPLFSASSVSVRSAPRESAGLIDTLEEAGQVAVDCTVRGETVDPPTGGGSTDVWDHIVNPSGYISDGYVDTGRTTPVAPTCSGAGSQSSPEASRDTGALPVVSRSQMGSEVRELLYEFHEHVVNHDDRAAWDLLSARKRSQSEHQYGYRRWASNQDTLNPYLEPAGIEVSVLSTDPRSGVATVKVRGMKWTKPGSPCSEWSGITWVKYEHGVWRYDPGYSTTPQRERYWKGRYSELLGGRC